MVLPKPSLVLEDSIPGAMSKPQRNRARIREKANRLVDSSTCLDNPPDEALEAIRSVVGESTPDILTIGAGLRLVRVAAIAREFKWSFPEMVRWLEAHEVPLFPLQRSRGAEPDPANFYINLWRLEVVLFSLTWYGKPYTKLPRQQAEDLFDNLLVMQPLYASANQRTVMQKLKAMAAADMRVLRRGVQDRRRGKRGKRKGQGGDDGQ